MFIRNLGYVYNTVYTALYFQDFDSGVTWHGAKSGRCALTADCALWVNVVEAVPVSLESTPVFDQQLKQNTLTTKFYWGDCNAWSLVGILKKPH